MWVFSRRHAPATLPPGSFPVPTVEEAPRAGLNGRGNSRPYKGFDLRIVQHVARHYTATLSRSS